MVTVERAPGGSAIVRDPEAGAGGPRLRDQRIRAAQMMAEGLSYAQVSDVVKVSQGTLRKWRREDPEFQAKLRECQALNAESARDRLIGLVETAIGVLAEVACDPAQPGNFRVSAANSLLDRAGVRPRSPEDRANDNADLEAMTPAELARALEEAAAVARAKASLPDTQTTVTVSVKVPETDPAKR